MRAALALAAAALALGMARRPPEGKSMQDLTAVDVSPAEWRGAQCSVAGPGARVVTDAAAWEALWKEAFSAPAPAVDFSKYAAVAVFAGVKPTGGWSPEFLAPAAKGDGAVVAYRVKGPAPGSFVIQAFTQPYAVRLYRRPKGALTAEERR